MKTWLKYGLIGFVLALVISTISYLFGLQILWELFIYPVRIPLILIIGGSSFLFNPIFMSFVLVPVFYFIIGAIIGWIVGKIKSKKQEQMPVPQK